MRTPWMGSGSGTAAALVVAFVLGACGGGTDGSPDAGADSGADPGGLPGSLLGDYCAPLAASLCAQAETCGCGAVLPEGTLDEAACRERLTADCLEGWQPIVGGATLDAARARACVARVEEATPACAKPTLALTFTVCPGAFFWDAAPLGARCDAPFCGGGDGACVDGVCTRRGDVGAPCDSPFACRAGLLCLAGTCAAPRDAGGTCGDDAACASPLRCVEGSCAAPVALGGACAVTEACAIGLACEGGVCAARAEETCDPSRECGSHTRCTAPRVCVARGDAGAPCASSEECDDASACADSVCVARPGEGEPCADGILCAPGLGCDLEDGSLCRPLPGEGAACLFGALGPSLCADGLACLEGTCGPLPGEGEPCAIDNACAGDLGCDFSPVGSFCIVRRGEGGACESDRSCADGFHCGEGSCTADLPDGSPCSVGNECAGVCGLDASGGFACRAAPGLGDPCLFTEDCATGACAADAARARCVPEVCGAL